MYTGRGLNKGVLLSFELIIEAGITKPALFDWVSNWKDVDKSLILGQSIVSIVRLQLIKLFRIGLYLKLSNVGSISL